MSAPGLTEGALHAYRVPRERSLRGYLLIASGLVASVALLGSMLPVENPPPSIEVELGVDGVENEPPPLGDPAARAGEKAPEPEPQPPDPEPPAPEPVPEPVPPPPVPDFIVPEEKAPLLHPSPGPKRRPRQKKSRAVPPPRRQRRRRGAARRERPGFAEARAARPGDGAADAATSSPRPRRSMTRPPARAATRDTAPFTFTMKMAGSPG